MEYIKSDRKQIFGAEVLDRRYMEQMARICNDQIMNWTLTSGETTQPLTHWVR